MFRKSYLIIGFLCLSILKCSAIPIQEPNGYYEYEIEKNSTILKNDNEPLMKCPEDFTLLGKKCYYVEIANTQDWFDALGSCGEKNGLLAIIKNAAEMSRLNEHLSSLKTEENFWISGDDVITEGKFVWGVDDDEMIYTNWADENQNNESRNCVNLKQINGNYLMVVDRCTGRNAFVCEIEPQETSADNQLQQERQNIKTAGTEVPQTLTSHQKTNPSMGEECPNNFIKLANNCYYVEHERMLNWYAAHRQCKQMDAEIVTIENDEEMKDIANHLQVQLYDRNRDDSWGTVGFWTGGNDLGSEGEFHWVSNGEEVTYSKWYEDEPNNVSDDEHCLEVSYMESDYYMNDHVCSKQKFFICEAEPKTKSLLTPKITGTCEELNLMRLNLDNEYRLVSLLQRQQQCPETNFNLL